MYLYGPGNTQIWTDSNRNFSLRQYGRLEYGASEVGWITASLARNRPAKLSRASRSRLPLRVRMRYFLNSFRGFAAFDVHGHDDIDHT